MQEQLSLGAVLCLVLLSNTLAATSPPPHHNSLLFFSQQKCGKSSMAYYILSAKKTFTFFYEPYTFNNATQCSHKCSCSGSLVSDNALSVTHLSGLEQFARGHKHIQGCEKFINIENLVHNAHSHGYHYVLVNERRNILKLIISSIETNVGHRGISAVYDELVRKQNDIITLLEMHSLTQIVARLTALSLKMKVISTNYQYNMGDDVCDIVKTAAFKLRKHMNSYSFNNLNCTGEPCFTENIHNDDLSLEERVTSSGKTLLETLLNNTPYSWMLSLNLNDWPNPEANPYFSVDPVNFLDHTGEGVTGSFDIKLAYETARCMSSGT